QLKPSGDFPTVKSPNPEEPEALAKAIELAKLSEADILIGTDPDADRLGVGVRNKDGSYTLLNGNQTNTLITYYLLNSLKEKDELSPYHFIGSTIVMANLKSRSVSAIEYLDEIYEDLGVYYEERLLSFKKEGQA
ncbi:unnamed protein product, partial [Cyprideis torosa]